MLVKQKRRRIHWWDRKKRYFPPECAVRSVYELEDSAKGKVVFIVAPGPSFEDFPIEQLGGQITIGVNSTLELMKPKYWLFQEGILAKKYFPYYAQADATENIVTTIVRTDMLKYIVPSGKTLWYYQSEPRITSKFSKPAPHWRWPEVHFLPGRCSVASTAMSLAELMRPRAIVLIGVDFATKCGQYYSDGVMRNPGPTVRDKALGAGRAWCLYAISKRAWRAAPIYTTSPYLKLGRRISRISIDRALQLTEDSK